jgi:hypothetical protein
MTKSGYKAFCYDCNKYHDSEEVTKYCERQVCLKCRETALVQFKDRPEILKLYQDNPKYQK